METYVIPVRVSGYKEYTIEASSAEEAVQLASIAANEDDFGGLTDIMTETQGPVETYSS